MTLTLWTVIVRVNRYRLRTKGMLDDFKGFPSAILQDPETLGQIDDIHQLLRRKFDAEINRSSADGPCGVDDASRRAAAVPGVWERKRTQFNIPPVSFAVGKSMRKAQLPSVSKTLSLLPSLHVWRKSTAHPTPPVFAQLVCERQDSVGTGQSLIDYVAVKSALHVVSPV